MNNRDLRVNASFGLAMGMYFTFDLGLANISFLRVGEEEVGGLVVAGFEGAGGFVVGVVFTSFSSSSYFWFTSCVMMYFICFSSS
jgi:hypothetical protein